MLKKYFFLFYLIMMVVLVHAQDSCVVYGKITDAQGNPLNRILVSSVEANLNVITTVDGLYRLRVAVKPKVEILFRDAINSALLKTYIIYDAISNQEYQVSIITNKSAIDLTEYVVHDEKTRGIFITPVDPKLFQSTVNPNMNFESVLRMLGPIAMNNELSSQYNVRGGNFDENLIYVNDIEIYRPQLVRTGQQEGLSFINPDMVQNVKFSAGGFEARYGDKMSSVLDVQYKKLTAKDTTPTFTLNANLMGGMFNAQGLTKNRKFSYLMGVRYRSNKYLLNSLEVQGNYKPRFVDFQGYYTYQINSSNQLSLLVSHADNKYLFFPQSQTTSFGTVSSALQLSVAFQGSQLTRTITDLAALTYKFDYMNKVQMKIIASAYRSDESESFDVIGGYELGDLDNDLGSKNFGKVKNLRGVGAFMNHGRNQLKISVLNLSHRGQFYGKKSKMQWGVGVQQEVIHDKLSEWRLEDSSEFLTPFIPGPDLNLLDVLRTSNSLVSHRINGYIQNENRISKKSDFTVNYGIRSQWWSVNEQATVSPRLSFSFKPFKKYNQHIDSLRQAYKDSVYNKKPDWLFKFSAGVYHQPPFYRELRRLDGTLNTNLKAQRSIHFIGGADLNFKAWKRPFKFVAEVYYKKYDSLVPYDIDNVKIRYYANNNSRGYATGIDFRLNGEFIETLESWVSLSLMKTSERIIGYEHWRFQDDQGYLYLNRNPQGVTIVDSQYVTYFPRPTDQRYNFNIFFQDHLPNNPRYRMSMNIVYAAGLPTSPPLAKELRNSFRVPPYRRLDIGFSKVMIDETKRVRKGFGKNIKNMWIALEVFNLLQFNNTVSFLWIEDLSNRQFAVPNYLTSRRINLHLVAKF